MTSLPRGSSEAPKKQQRRRKGRTPLGFFIAGLLSGELDTVATMREVLGEAFGDRLVDAFVRVRWGVLEAVHFFEVRQHDPNEECVRIACAHALQALERTSPENQRACSSALFRGHTHRIDENGSRVYVPGDKAGGLAARLGRSPRTLDRHCRVLELAGICDVWQPPPDQTLPKTMRGHRFCYAVYEWRPQLPRELLDRLIEWWGTAEQRKLSTRRRRRVARVTGPARGSVSDPQAGSETDPVLERRAPLTPEGRAYQLRLEAYLAARGETEPVPPTEAPPEGTRGQSASARATAAAFLAYALEHGPAPEPPS